MSTDDSSSPPPPRIGTLARLRFLVGGIILAVPAFAACVAGFVVGVGTLVVWVGLPVLVATATMASAFAAVERRATEAVTGRPLPPHVYRAAGADNARHLVQRASDPQRWRDLVHAVLGLPVRWGTGLLALAWAVGGAALSLSAAWLWILPRGDTTGLVGLVTGSRSFAWEIIANTSIGLLLVLSSPAVTRAMVTIRVAFARGLLTNETAALRARAEQPAGDLGASSSSWRYP